jgi:DNA invertase Pin-like site-specific DNA recombinase
MPSIEAMTAVTHSKRRFHVTRIDRLARSLRDLQNLIYELKERDISLKATKQLIDTNTTACGHIFSRNAGRLRRVRDRHTF